MDQFPIRDEAMWQAVLNRDGRFDGSFVYAVRSTGIYCRPSCPARRPGRDQVFYYLTSEAARQAGYRACLRCHPDSANAPAVDLAMQVRDYLDMHADDRVTLMELGRVFHHSPFHLQRTFKQVMGLTPKEYALNLRLERLKTSLRVGLPVTDAQFDAGFGSSSSLYAVVPNHLGMTPTAYQAGGDGERIQYIVTDSPLGWLLVAYTARGVCMVSLGDDHQQLKTALEAEFPRASLERVDDPAHPWALAIQHYLRGTSIAIDVPADLHGTAFQRKVWQALCRIPYGSTSTYQQIATALEKPGAVRAVGHACATNPVALIVPCHRVIRSDGGLGGYRWGLQRKQKLLEQERQASQQPS